MSKCYTCDLLTSAYVTYENGTYLLCNKCDSKFEASDFQHVKDFIDNANSKARCEMKQCPTCPNQAVDTALVCGDCFRSCRERGVNPSDLLVPKAVKHDEGKVRLDLIHPVFMEQLGQALTYGAKKYGDTNYLKGGLSYLRLFGSLMRHLWAWARREDLDPESGLPHLAHAAGALMMLTVVVDKKLGEDDRL